MLSRRRSLSVEHRLDLGLRFAELGQDLQGLGRFRLVDPAHRETDMHQYPIAEANLERMGIVDYAGYIDLPADTADIDGGERVVGIVEPDDLAGYS
jgi:hypothetical protein